MLNSNKIFVGNIPFEYDEESLKRVLSLVGPIENFEIKKDRNTQKSQGFGFCTYESIDVAESALRNLKDIEYKSRTLRIKPQANDRIDNLNEDIKKVDKDISFIKDDNFYNEIKLSNTLLGLVDKQKLLTLFLFNNLCFKDKNIFNLLLENQSEETLDAIIALQEDIINKYK